eukprot:scaffold659834_cov47-Prasinocladus_malaysianus.AAC.1
MISDAFRIRTAAVWLLLCLYQGTLLFATAQNTTAVPLVAAGGTFVAVNISSLQGKDLRVFFNPTSPGLVVDPTAKYGYTGYLAGFLEHLEQQ